MNDVEISFDGDDEHVLLLVTMFRRECARSGISVEVGDAMKARLERANKLIPRPRDHRNDMWAKLRAANVKIVFD